MTRKGANRATIYRYFAIGRSTLNVTIGRIKSFLSHLHLIFFT
jgi:hypothetical protein